MLLSTTYHSQFNRACFALRTIHNCAHLSDYGRFPSDHHILKIKLNKVYQGLDGRLKEVTTIGKWPKGVRGRLIEVAV